MSENIIDLTDDSSPTKTTDNHHHHSAVGINTKRPRYNSANDPIGVNLTFDIVDLVDDNHHMAVSDCKRPTPVEQKKRTMQTHPLKFIEASKKRKREREEARKREEEARRQEELKKLAEEQREEQRRRNILNRVNFILVDDSSDDEDAEVEVADVEEAQSQLDQTQLDPEPSLKPTKATTEWVYHLPKRTNKTRKQPAAKRGPSQYQSAFDKDSTEFSYYMSNEDAAQLQERMFQEAAERLRARTPSSNITNGNKSFRVPMINIAHQFPDHWKWKEPYSCLGLPTGASLTLVKTHYRALARVYHPDKSKEANTTRKFQGIARAYHKLTLVEATPLDR